MISFLFLFAVLFRLCVSENLDNITVELGQNVTLNCSLAEKGEIDWFIQRRSERPVFILRSFTSPVYNKQHKEFKEKYKILNPTQLFIHNVTRNVLGSYYCGAKDPLIFSKATVLEEAGAIVPDIPCNCTENIEKDCLTSWMSPALIASCFLNTVFITLLLGVISKYSVKKKRRVEEPTQPGSPVYSDINVSRPTRPARIEYTAHTPYAVVRLPASGQQTLGQQRLETRRNQVRV